MVIHMKIYWKSFIIITIITFVVGSFFEIISMNNMETYNGLIKPFSIPGIVFPIVWSILYLLMSISCYIIYESNNINKKIALIIYFVQLIINSLWSLLFFGFNLYLISFLWILLLIVFVIIMIVKFYKINKLSGLLQIPYLLWTIFAGYLNFMIYILNR